MSSLFGTDGVRGLAGVDITAGFALELAQAAATVFARQIPQGRRAKAVVGRDPRISGDYLAAAVCAGLASCGVEVHDLGILPTPAVAFLVGHLNADFGVMISASHNPAHDNGIKFFGSGGMKLSAAIEAEITEAFQNEKTSATGEAVGRILPASSEQGQYEEHLLRSLQGVSLEGLHIVLDCAHGAASQISPNVFARAGARVTTIGNNPDGLNINEGVGSTALALLQETVRGLGADIGIAHDGDADRCLAIDSEGNIVDGDKIMAILTLSLAERGLLKHNTLVTTVMSNMGLRKLMEERGIRIEQTAVGDKYVLEVMNREGYSIGGEQSGHVILGEYAFTGDGILTGLHLAREVARSGRSLADLAACMEVYPQVLINVRGVDRSRVDADAGVQEAVATAERELGQNGRVLLRPSGTEPLVRVMVEAASETQARKVAEDLATTVRTYLSV